MPGPKQADRGPSTRARTALALVAVAATEAIDTTFGVDELLLTGKERVAVRANGDLGRLLGGADFPLCAAGAADRGVVVVFRMDIRLHKGTSYAQSGS